MLKSPLNYHGGKTKLLPQLLPLFPKQNYQFYDLFCGVANVGINVSNTSIYCIDKNKPLIDLYQFIQSTDNLIEKLDEKIAFYGLTNSSLYGKDGKLSEINKTGYLKLREDYNQTKDSLLFLLCIIYGFNNQIRFNQKQQFNIPVGKQDFNKNLRKNLVLFMDKIKPIQFICEDFRNMTFNPNAFVYCDPPYLLGEASYNLEWKTQDEKDLLDLLLKLNNQNTPFALSNVIEHKNKTNTILLEWLEKHQFNVHHLNFHYNNSNYQSTKSITKEVLITNYN